MDPLEPVSCREEGLQDSFLGYMRYCGIAVLRYCGIAVLRYCGEEQLALRCCGDLKLTVFGEINHFRVAVYSLTLLKTRTKKSEFCDSQVLIIKSIAK